MPTDARNVCDGLREAMLTPSHGELIHPPAQLLNAKRRIEIELQHQIRCEPRDVLCDAKLQRHEGRELGAGFRGSVNERTRVRAPEVSCASNALRPLPTASRVCCACAVEEPSKSARVSVKRVIVFSVL